MGFNPPRWFYSLFKVNALQIEIYKNGKLQAKLYRKDEGQDLVVSKKYGAFRIPENTEFSDNLFRIIRYDAGKINPYMNAGANGNGAINEEVQKTNTRHPGVDPLNPLLLKSIAERISLNKVLKEDKTLNDTIILLVVLFGGFALVIITLGIMFGGW